MGTAKADHKAIDTDIHLETDNGNLIKIDSDSWFQWLEENASFKFTAGFGGEDSYRARKEVLGGVVYWYAFKKVNGKLHKRYIGKPHEVTHNRLREVAKSIRDVKVKPAKEDKINNDSNQLGNTNLQGIVNQLVNQVQELTNRLDNLESRGDDTTTKKLEYLPSEELEAKIQELTNELANKDSNLSELTIQLSETTIEAKAVKNDATLLNQEVQRLTSELDNLNSKLTELTNELANKDRELQELQSNPPAPVPQSQINEELTTDNGQFHEEYVQKYLTPKPEKQRLDPAIYTRNYQIVSMLDCQFWMDGKKFNQQDLKDNEIDKNITTNKAEIETLLGAIIKTKNSVIQRFVGILKAMGFELKGNPKDGYYITNPEIFN
ncbi:MAG: hypothetical protein RLZZ29_359 [Cyanobacteriota bacterium]|jgi:chromosome segregation ATPase